jgi:electron transfer flavoprotein beta subunit
MHILVCIKQVPDSAQIRVHPVTNTIMRQGVPSIINPYDLFALEEALSLRDRIGGMVTVLTMGPLMAEDSLRKALTYGADRAVLLTDRAFAGSDTLATSFALATAIEKIGELWGRPELVFTGKQTIDGDTAQVGPGIAKRLGYRQLTYVANILALNLGDGCITVDRRAEGGVQRLRSQLPVLITMLDGTNEIRRGTVADALRASRAEVVKFNAQAIGISDLSQCGLKGSPTIVKQVYAPSAREERADMLASDGHDADGLADVVWSAIFQKHRTLEEDLVRRSVG